VHDLVGDRGAGLIWDPATPGASPDELGHHNAQMRAVAVLPDGRVVTGANDGQVLIWDLAGATTRVMQLNYSPD
jgi:hypothetical protein